MANKVKVNQTNDKLMKALSCVDGAIHKVAGFELLQECWTLEATNGIRCPVGEARITGSGQLKSKFVIHTVGPIYKNADNPAELLRRAYINSIELALQNDCKSIAFPAISCGKYGYPYDEAVDIATSTLKPYLDKNIEIYFYLFEKELYQMYLDKV